MSLLRIPMGHQEGNHYVDAVHGWEVENGCHARWSFFWQGSTKETYLHGEPWLICMVWVLREYTRDGYAQRLLPLALTRQDPEVWEAIYALAPVLPVGSSLTPLKTMENALREAIGVEMRAGPYSLVHPRAGRPLPLQMPAR